MNAIGQKFPEKDNQAMVKNFSISISENEVKRVGFGSYSVPEVTTIITIVSDRKTAQKANDEILKIIKGE